jgi:S1-C subfamily serine protease
MPPQQSGQMPTYPTYPTPPPWASPYPQWYPPAPQAPHRRRRGPIAAAVLGGTAAAVALGLGINAAVGGSGLVSGQGAGPSQNPAPAANTTGMATSAQQVGVVDIDTVLQYQGAEAAGTGMILTSSGEVLTNNHVVEGATSIKVTVVSTGNTYTAKVVGTDPSDDVAVIQLQGASGLATAKIGNSSDVSVGDAVTAVGNAGGRGGTPSAASGTVTATGQTMTASDENGSNAETLTDMIETNANVVAGDSGGPLYDANNKIIGMDTAASSSGGFGQGGLGSGGFPGGLGSGDNGSGGLGSGDNGSGGLGSSDNGSGGLGSGDGSADGSGSDGTSQTVAYAIPIDKALNIADQIESGHETSKIHIGYPAFLGVSLQDSFNGPVVASVGNGTPAEQAGLQAGDTVTSVDGKTIDSADALSSAISGHNPGDKITLTWTDTSGQSHTATVTLTTGPAD